MDKLTIADLEFIETNEEAAISMIRKYAVNYAGQSHYEQLGASCVMSIVNTVDTVIGSAEYLEGEFVMPDQIHVERLASWFIANKEYICDENVLLFFMADYTKRKINELYRWIQKSKDTDFKTTFTLAGHKKARKKLREQIKTRRQKGVKIIRLTRISSQTNER